MKWWKGCEARYCQVKVVALRMDWEEEFFLLDKTGYFILLHQEYMYSMI